MLNGTRQPLGSRSETRLRDTAAGLLWSSCGCSNKAFVTPLELAVFTLMLLSLPCSHRNHQREKRPASLSNSKLKALDTR